MKKAIAIIVSLVFVFVLTAVSFAEETGAAPAGEQTTVKKADKKQVTGEVITVDTVANTITVKKPKKEVTVSVDDKTKVMTGKDKKTFADVKVGDKVTVKYTTADGKNTAQSVDIKAVPAKKVSRY